jgi:hypothetical protein
MIVQFNETRLRHLSIHRSGSRSANENLVLSEKELSLHGEEEQQGLEDFFKGIQGKMAGVLPYKEYSLAQVIDQPSSVLVQSSIYQDTSQSISLKEMEINQKITFWNKPQNISHQIYIFLVSCMFKQVDIAIINYHTPDLYALNLAKKIYVFTGSGYVQVKWGLINSLWKSLIVFYKISKVYLRMISLIKNPNS